MSRKQVWGTLAVLPQLLCGCGTSMDPSSLVNASAKTLVGDFSAQTANEETLISELQNEDESLRFISKGKYSCGNPKLLAKIVSTDPASYVKKEKIDKDFQNARSFVEAYIKAMSDVVSANTSDQATLSALSGAAKLTSSFAPNAASAAAMTSAIGALATLASLGLNAAADAQIRQIATTMEPGLELAVATLKKHYPAFSEGDQRVFRDWDECAVEKLVFIRDQPNREVKGYENYSYIFSRATGLDLDTSYNAYLTMRKTLKYTPISDATFDQVVAANKKLMQFDFSAASWNATIQNLGTLNSDFQAAMKAVQALNPPQQNPSPTQKKKT